MSRPMPSWPRILARVIVPMLATLALLVLLILTGGPRAWLN